MFSPFTCRSIDVFFSASGQIDREKEKERERVGKEKLRGFLCENNKFLRKYFISTSAYGSPGTRIKFT